MASLKPTDLIDIAQGALTTQDYTPKVWIDGVKIVDLALHSDDGGHFAEMVRFNDDGTFEQFPDFTPKQQSYSLIVPGAVKAFHLHFNQEDIWFVPPGQRVLIGLVDCRKDSPTRGIINRFVMGDGKAKLLHIPCGVAHGGANIWKEDAMIFYYVTQKFDIKNPDERRLPYDLDGLVPKDFWNMTMG